MSLQLGDSSIVDIFWGTGFVVVACLAFALTPQGYLPCKILVSAVATIWGLRLALHLGIRNWRQPEDFGYAKWRVEHGARWGWFSYSQVFLLQGFLMWLISAPLVAAETAGFPAILTPLDWTGVWVWALGLLFESIGDAQLRRFNSNRNRLTAASYLPAGYGDIHAIPTVLARRSCCGAFFSLRWHPESGGRSSLRRP